MQDAKEEVRSRLNIEDIIGEYVQLKRAGRNYKGLSPFTNERTPSFTVSPEKNIWHDFSSGKGGDIFSFIMEVEGLEFREALEKLAQKAGVELSMFDSKKSGELAKQKKRLLEANELACRYFQQCLIRNRAALEYVFKKRGLNKKVVSDFRIGYAPSEGDAMVRALKKRGFSNYELRRAGLVNRFDGDLFRGRITLPLMDSNGQVVGFTGRTLVGDDKGPKYLNTPGTLLYDKSRLVFGLSLAKQAIRTNDQAVVVEGNLDVVSSHQAGFSQAVATSGTAITEHHLKTLGRLSSNVKLAFDGDKAGIAASERAIVLAQQVGVELSVVNLPSGFKDPDELIQENPELWQKALEEAQPAVDWVLVQYAMREDLSTAQGKRLYTNAALAIVHGLRDSVEREHYLGVVSREIGTSLASLEQKLERGGKTESPTLKKIKPKSENKPEPKTFAYHNDVLAMLVASPSARQLLEGVDIELFSSSEQRQLAKYLLVNHQPFNGVVPSDLQSIDTYVKIVELRAEERYAKWPLSDIELEAAHLLRQMQIEHKKQTLKQLNKELRVAEEDGDDARAEELRPRIASLIKETARGR